jgi:hypothetical protein
MAAPTPVQAFKSIRCWLYQCNEGNCDQHPLFQAFQRIAAAIAEGIVQDMPMYEMAAWDTL